MQASTPRAAAPVAVTAPVTPAPTPKEISPQTEVPQANTVPIEVDDNNDIVSVTTIESNGPANNNPSEVNLIDVKSVTVTETITQEISQSQSEPIVESVTVIETNEIKSKPNAKLNGDRDASENGKSLEVENNEMTGK